MLEFIVRAVVANPNVSQKAVVYLLNFEKKILVPIEMGWEAADYVMQAQSRVRNPRPITHRTTNKIINALGGEFTKIIIYKKMDGIFYAYIQIKKEDSYLEIDSRPSDAITMALLQNKPIYIIEKVYKKFGIELNSELLKEFNQFRYS